MSTFLQGHKEYISPFLQSHKEHISLECYMVHVQLVIQGQRLHILPFTQGHNVHISQFIHMPPYKSQYIYHHTRSQSIYNTILTRS